MKTINNTLAIRQATEAVLAARDFCGDERRAAIEALAEEDVRATPDALSAVFNAADAEWAVMNSEAGVIYPLLGEERAEAYRALEPSA